MTPPLAGRTVGLLTASASRLGGGVFEAVVGQAELIRRLGGTVRVFALADPSSEEDRARLGAAEVTYCAVRGVPQVGYAPGLVRALRQADLDCLHLHGIWMYPSRAGALWARHTRRPYVISPHGMLDPWITARGRWKKALARAGYERASWRAAAAFHALTDREAADIRRESGRVDSIVIPNPGPDPVDDPGAARPLRAVYIGRIHPKKNLGALVAGWAQARLPEGSRLTIAGWGEPAHVADLEAALSAIGPSAEYVGPVFGEAKQALLASARIVCLPSLSEGLPMAILESWAAGVPTVMTRECNLPQGFATGAALECGFDAASIATALAQALTWNEEAWTARSRAALALARGTFSANAVTRQWGYAYAALIGSGKALP